MSGPDHPSITVFHAPLLAALHAAAFSSRGDRAWSAEEFQGLLGLDGVFGYLATHGEDDLDALGPDALGFVLARALAGEGEILTIATRPDHGRRGVGRGLLDLAVAECAARGAERLFLEVAEDNAPARALYAGSGFTRQGRRRGYYRRGAVRVDALVLSRDLVKNKK